MAGCKSTGLLLCALLVIAVYAADPPVEYEECGHKHNIDVAETEIDSGVAYLHWSWGDTNRVWVRSYNGTIYASKDSGNSWRDVSDLLPGLADLPHTLTPGISQLIPARADDTIVYLKSWTNVFWTNGVERAHDEQKDPGDEVWEHFEKRDPEQLQNHRLHSIIPHPHHAAWALLFASTNKCHDVAAPGECHYDLFVTKDFGKTVEKLFEYVRSAAWGYVDEHVFWTAVDNPSGDQLQQRWSHYTFHRSEDLGKTIHSSRQRSPFFFFSDAYLFVATLTSEDSSTLNLYSSGDEGRTFKRLFFGDVEVSERGYSILDTTEGSTFANVVHDDNRYGTLFVADSMDENFTPSLEKHRRSLSGYTDFQRVLGLEGIYIANYYDIDDEDELPGGGQDPQDPQDPPPVIDFEKRVKTVITFDKGGIWHELPVPANVKCKDEGCSLHLFGMAQTMMTRVYSTASATGLILATGNTGVYQQAREDELDTYYSRDAGVTWERIRRGEHVYEFGDHGSLMLLANNEEETNRVLFSWNEGMSWNECNFTASHKPVDVINIRVDPPSTAETFILHGERTKDGATVGLLVHLNFTGLHERTCRGADVPDTKESDYETWVPQYHDQCVLGSKVQYIRRKREAQCFNPKDHDTKKTVSRCPCTQEDYECDGVCFHEHTQPDGTIDCLNVCAGEEHDPWKVPSDCKKFWHRPTGWRRIQGDNCALDGGLNLEAQLFTCDGEPYEGTTSDANSPLRGFLYALAGVLAVLVALAVIVGIFVIGYKTNEQCRDTLSPYIPNIKLGGGSDDGDYSLVSGLMGDDDDTGIGIEEDDDFGHGAEVLQDSEMPIQRISSLPPVAGPDDDDDEADEVPSLQAPPSSSLLSGF